MNHQKESEKIVNYVENCGTDDESTLNVALAQTHALLAVAEQLRIGNLIALTNAGSNPTDDSAEWGQDDEVRKRAYNGLIDFMEYDHLTTYPVLNPQVADALGIEQP